MPLYPSITNNIFDHIWQKDHSLKYFYLVMKIDGKVESCS